MHLTVQVTSIFLRSQSTGIPISVFVFPYLEQTFAYSEAQHVAGDEISGEKSVLTT